MNNKLIIFLLITIMIIAVIPVNAFARMDTNIGIGDTTAISSSNKMIRRILGVIQVIGSIISVVGLVIIGLRYMLSSISEKADMKGVLMYYVVGCILVFATSNILGIAYDILWNLKI